MGTPGDESGLEGDQANDLAAFEAIMASAFADEAVIFGAPGDPSLVPAAPAAPRPAVDLGVAGSLTQTRRRVRAARKAQLGPALADPRTLVPALLLITAVAYAVAVVAVESIPGRPWLVVPLAVLVAAAAAGWLALRRGWSAEEWDLWRTEVAEEAASRGLRRSFQGTPWVLLHDRLLPGTEHRLSFVAVGPAGVAVLTILPRGPYMDFRDQGFMAADEELTAAWLPTRLWEARLLLEALVRTPARDLVFRGPVFPLALVAYLKRMRVPSGWSALPPVQLQSLPIRNAVGAGRFLRSLPSPLSSSQVGALVALIDDLCPPAPTA